ncbi:MAG: hypothetical protein KF749_09795 [Bacteroidetes bacterium]|nr:hypothetical protein [Bacteroidota bacterium]MCW5895039.1 hypothetical protein [Bacteroidota bacterium]
MNAKQCLLLLASVMLTCSCNDVGEQILVPPDSQTLPTITQGVWGIVYFWKGDFMPGGPPRGTITPVSREIYVYEATRSDQVVSEGIVFYQRINTRFVTKTKSNRSGFYQVALPPGKYSFFVKEGSLFYANYWDGEGHILPGAVYADSLTNVRIDITYEATF